MNQVLGIRNVLDQQGLSLFMSSQGHILFRLFHLIMILRYAKIKTLLVSFLFSHLRMIVIQAILPSGGSSLVKLPPGSNSETVLMQFHYGLVLLM